MKKQLKTFFYLLVATSFILVGCDTTQQSEGKSDKSVATVSDGESLPPQTEKEKQELLAAAEEAKKLEQGTGPAVTAEVSPAEAQPTPAKAEGPAVKAETPAAESKPAEVAAPAPAEVKAEKVVEATPAPTAKPTNPKYVGMVSIMNPKKKFVVVDFGENMPPLKSELGVYRHDVFVGSIRVTNPVKAPFATADIVTGTLKTGDEVR